MGCGIAGMTSAFLLAEQGHRVTLFEQAPQCMPVGAGIMIQTSGQQVLQRLGLLDSLLPLAQRLDGMTAVLANGRKLIELDFKRRIPEMYALGVHRGTLFGLLMNRCHQAGVTIRTGFRAVRFDADQGELWADDDSTASGFDFLVVADGSRSVLRQHLVGQAHVTEYTYGALWGTGCCDYQPGRLYQVVDGTERLAGLLPIGNGQSSYFWGLPVSSWPELKRSNFDRWRRDAILLCPQAESILGTLKGFEDLTFGTYRSVKMKINFYRRAVFIGDAAHATSPHLGQGANLALEDAQGLADCISQAAAEGSELTSALRNFHRIRYRKIRFYRQLTALLSPFFQSQCRWRSPVRNLLLPIMPHLPLVGPQMLYTLSGLKRGWFG